MRVEGTLGLVAGLFCARLVAGSSRIAPVDRPLVATVEQRLSFTERVYGPWLLMASATSWLLTLAITTLIDNGAGSYRVSHPAELVPVTDVMFGITYLSSRFATIDAVREQRAVLHDLQAEALDATPGLEPARRRSRVVRAVGVVLLALAVISGVALWIANA
jgi:hypothetical protein